jgi:hypothetical protein
MRVYDLWIRKVSPRVVASGARFLSKKSGDLLLRRKLKTIAIKGSNE